MVSRRLVACGGYRRLAAILLRADGVERGLLLVAERIVERVERRTHRSDRLEHGVEPCLHGREARRRRPCIARRT